MTVIIGDENDGQEAEVYQAQLSCRRCGRPRLVPLLAEKFRHWFCHRDKDGKWCMTMNVWR